MKKLLATLAFTLLAFGSAHADENVKAGETSRCFDVFVGDSSSTVGAGKTGLAYNSSGLTGYYHRSNASSATSITLANMTLGTFTSGGFKEVDSTNMPGWYQFCPPDTAFASGAKEVSFALKGVTNMAQVNLRAHISPAANVASVDSSAIEETDFAPTSTFGSGSTTTSLQLNGSETSNSITNQQICVTSGGAAKDCTICSAYNTSTKVASGCSPALTTAPASGDGYAIGGLTEAAKVQGNVDGNVTGSVGSLAIQAKTDVKSMITEFFDSDSVSELTSCPGPTTTLKTMLRFIFQAIRNPLVANSSGRMLYRDNGSTTLCTSSGADNGTNYTRGKWQ